MSLIRSLQIVDYNETGGIGGPEIELIPTRRTRGEMCAVRMSASDSGTLFACSIIPDCELKGAGMGMERRRNRQMRKK